MSEIYDNWGKLVEAVVKREQYKKLCFSSISSDCAASTSSRRISLDLSSSDLHDGNSESFATTSSASTHLDHVPKPPNMPSGSRFDKIFGAARRFVTPVRKRPESQMENVTNHAKDINAPGFQSGHKDSAPVEVEVLMPSPTIDQYALSLEELKGKTYNFGQDAKIGEGSNGLVYFAQLESGKDVALKKLDESFEFDSNVDFLTQVSMLLRLKHENLVELLGYCVESNIGILAYDFATMGTLCDILHGRKRVREPQPGPVLDWMQRVRIALDAARGLEYLHENAILHKNITSSNVLLFEDLKAKIADANLSHKARRTYASNPDPLYYYALPRPIVYNAPEFAMGENHTQKSDIYSFGVVLLELLTGRKPVDITMPPGHHYLVSWATPRLSEDKVKLCVDPKLKGEYPPKAAAKMAATAALCTQYESEFRPDMRIIVKCLQSVKASARTI